MTFGCHNFSRSTTKRMRKACALKRPHTSNRKVIELNYPRLHNNSTILFSVDVVAVVAFVVDQVTWKYHCVLFQVILIDYMLHSYTSILFYVTFCCCCCCCVTFGWLHCGCPPPQPSSPARSLSLLAFSMDPPKCSIFASLYCFRDDFVGSAASTWCTYTHTL